MESLARIYKDVCLLHLKYEHLSEVSATLLQPWPNCDSCGKSDIRGKSTASQSKEEAVTTELSGGQEELTPSQSTSAVSSHDTNSESKELADLRLLDSILTKAQKIRTVQPIESDTPKSSSKKAVRNSAKSMKMATQVYQHTKGVSSRTTTEKHGSSTSKSKLPPRAKSRSSSLKSTTKISSCKSNPRTSKTPSVTKEKFKQKPFINQFNLEGGGASFSNPEAATELEFNKESFGLSERVRDLSVTERKGGHEEVVCDQSENEMECFRIHKNGHLLSMPSRYTKIQKLLSRINSQCGDTVRQTAGVEGADHFSKRLLSQDSINGGPKIGLLLALDEYRLLKEELLSITPQEWAVSDKSRWQDILKVKTKVDSIIDHIQSLQAELSEEPLQSNVDHSHVHSTIEYDASRTTRTDHTVGPTSQTRLLSHTEPSLHTKRQFHNLSSDGQSPERLKNTRLGSHASSFHMGLDSIPASKSFAYMDLKEWQSLAMCEQQVLLQSWEADLIELIDKTILPLIVHYRESTLSSEEHSITSYSSLLQAIHRLVGHKDSISYLLVK